MAKAILICGKIACGKSTYARMLARDGRAVILSVDEITIGVLGGDLGQQHDLIAERTQKYLLHKSLEVLAAGADVVLDWGFWTREKRSSARAFYERRGIACEFHYVDVPEETWKRNIFKRNATVLAGETEAYYMDDGLMNKLLSLFEAPEREEIDVWYVNEWREDVR